MKSVKPQVFYQFSSQVYDQVTNQVSDRVYDQVFSQVWDQVYRQENKSLVISLEKNIGESEKDLL